MPTATLEAEYVVTAPGGITTSSGRHPHGSTVWLSDLDGGQDRLERLGLVLPTGNSGEPPERERVGDPHWVDDAHEAVRQQMRQPEQRDPLAEGLPDAHQSTVVIEALPDATAALAAALSEQPPPAIAADADPAAVLTQPVPAVIRFAQAHPEQAHTLHAAEQKRAKPRRSLLDALAAITQGG